MLAFMKVLQPKTVEEAYELATKNKTAPMLAGGCWLRLGRRTWPSVIDKPLPPSSVVILS